MPSIFKEPLRRAIFCNPLMRKNIITPIGSSFSAKSGKREWSKGETVLSIEEVALR